MLNTEAMIANKINISQAVGNRYDVSFYNERFDFISNSYPSYELGQILFVNPAVSYKHIADDDLISFVPMEAIDEQNGIIAIRKTILYSNIKGYTKFQEGDLLWAKITPCMQNGKSAIARNLVNGVGCGSTEFYVLRPKSDKVLIEYIHYILRDNRVLESARNSFGGSAGQQRVSSSYLKSIKIPLPPIEIQQQIVDIYITAQKAKQVKDEEAKSMLDNINPFLLEVLDITSNQQYEKKSTILTPISYLIGQRFDVSSYKEHFEMISNKYPNRKLSSLVEIDPAVKFAALNEDTPISFIPMECIDEKYGEISEQREISISKIKGYTRFEEGDLLWAKITPCMQNGKSAIARHLKNGVGCGSTEYFVIRPKTRDLLIDYVYLMLRHSEVLKAAQNSFGGSAGQQRVSSQYLRSIVIPFPNKDIQQSIVDVIFERKQTAKQLQKEGAELLEKAKQDIEKIILD